MATTIQVTTGGKVLTDGSGLVQRECCCNPCASDYPPLAVTVSWTGNPTELTGGTYSWLGEDFGNGDTRFICPTTYKCSKKATTTTNSYLFGTYCIVTYNYNISNYKNTWRYGTQLFLGANYVAYNQRIRNGITSGTVCVPTTPGFYYTVFIYDRAAQVFPLGGRSLTLSRFRTPLTTAFTQNSVGISTENLVPASSLDVTILPMRINGQQEGQLKTTSGVTISWERAVLPDWC